MSIYYIAHRFDGVTNVYTLDACLLASAPPIDRALAAQLAKLCGSLRRQGRRWHISYAFRCALASMLWTSLVAITRDTTEADLLISKFVHMLLGVPSSTVTQLSWSCPAPS